MNKSTNDSSTTLFAILFIGFIIGILFIQKHVTLFSYIALFLNTFLCYQIYRGKVSVEGGRDPGSLIFMVLFVTVFLCLSFLAKPHRYNSFIGKYFIPGKMVTKSVLVEDDEGLNTWEELRTYWEPYTKAGDRAMDGIGWLNFIIVMSSIVIPLIFFFKIKAKEDLEKNGFNSSDFP